MANDKAACSSNNSSSSKKAPARPAPPTTVHDIPDKLLELILINLTSSLHLVRAAATCRRWRRIITHTNFLIGITRPTPHPLAGHYHRRLHPPPPQPNNPKHHHIKFIPSSPDQLPFTGSLDFLPADSGGISRWEIIDSCGSLLLLSKKKSGSRTRRGLFPDLVVCEPVTRRYKAIPRMEGMEHHHCVAVFLLDADHSIATFRLTCVLYQPYFGVSEDVGTVKVCVYREDVWNWTRYMKPINDFEPPRLFEWYVVTEMRPGWKRRIHLHGRDSLRFLGHAEGYVFWAIKEHDDSLLVLDDYMNNFDIFSLSDGVRGSEVQAIVDVNGDDHDNVRIVTLEGDILRVVNWMYKFDVILLEKSLNLVEATCKLQGYKEGYFCSGAKVVTVSTSAAILMPVEETWMVSVDLETMEVVECKYASVAYPCELPWPPTLRACPVRCNRWGSGRCSHICVC